MEALTRLSANERRDVFTEAAAELGMPPFFVEKDFWVCWSLHTLFTEVALRGQLTFRGGTSLSKAWQCIERFSEDIDLAISRQFLGMSAEQDPATASLTDKAVEKRLSALRKATRAAMQNTLLPCLETSMQTSVGNRETWSLATGQLQDERDPFTLYLHYPQCGFDEGAGYHPPRVKIEVSARARSEPMETRLIQPYAAQVLPASVQPAFDIEVQCVTPRLTFWEKASLLHEQLTRPPAADGAVRAVALHQSRHLYDLHRLWTHHGLSADTSLRELFPEVTQHRKTFYGYSWVSYDGLTSASLTLLPPDEQLPAWRQDYQQMRAMFFGQAVPFETLLTTLREIQQAFRGER